jgi:N-acetylglucosamine-6-phosphate deacetylase
MKTSSKKLAEIYNMNLKIFILILSISLPICLATSEENMSDLTIEGIFYLDESPISLTIKNGSIDKIERKNSSLNTAKSKIYIAPGLIDNQVNGYMNVAFAGEGLTIKGIRKATQALWKEGVTTYLPTLTTNTRQLLKNNFSILAEAVKDHEIGLSIPGYHLEGPYISPVDGYRGAHVKKWVRPPDWNEFTEFLEAADGKILQVSLAPEVTGAFDFMYKLRQKGIVIGLAHHKGTAEEIKHATDIGAAISTHLGNGCANMINRHVNPLWPQLAEDRLMASIICDGFHLRPEEVRVFLKTKGTGGIVLTSDVTALAGMPPGEYTKRGRTVELTPEGKIILPSQNVLAGAASPITKGVGNVIKFTNCSLADAIHMASRNPANLYNLKDRGEIKVGKRADLILFTVENQQINIKKTILAGKEVYSSE